MKNFNLRVFLSLFLIVFMVSAGYSQTSKREFRGAWIQCVNGQFQGMSKDKMQSTLKYQLDELQKDGVNAIIFQVRPECDALYVSDIEPWSRFLTGRQGTNPGWDPLQWMIDESHKRGMELHAWINPYRAKTKNTFEMANNHIAIKHPDYVFAYDGQLILNPGMPECRDYICNVVRDIVSRYDVDGLHIDDYFYPYPVKGQKIPDADIYNKNNNGISNINDWRRDNVNVFVKQLGETIHEVKPWVKFGVSPFGIYRNKKNDAQLGSETNGLQNYDDLYADVLMWVNNGWIDYCVPQLYWEIGHKAADYKTLIKWWNKYASNRLLFIGEDIERTVKNADPDNPKINQMSAKRRLHSEMPNVQGTVLWYAKAAVDNVGNYGMALRNGYWKYPALQPLMTFIDGKSPKKVRSVKAMEIDGKKILFWTAPKGKGWQNEAVKYVVYKFDASEKVDISKSSNIVAITTDTFYEIADNEGGVYAVTALDRMSNESKPKKKRIK
ncbi:MAG: family 10 glycosylhydrolase [Prevotella sp.]|nr:family 10 glycosylhydrolase [Prevotella sp.]MBQ8629459.1 family 10 glycosylhydrolase [Prevotella sp.]